MKIWLSLVLLFIASWASAEQCTTVWPTNATGNSSAAPDIPSGLAYSGNLSNDTVLPSGTNYDFDSITFSGKDDLDFTGSGNVIIYLNSLTASGKSTMNRNNNVNLILIVNGSISITGNANINALIYTAGAASLSGNGFVYGAVTAAGGVSGGSHVTYDSSAVAAAEAGQACGVQSLTYPYTTGFEGDNSEWDTNGDFSVSNDSSGDRQPRNGNKVLDNNEADIDQSRHYSGHTAELNQSIAIPANASSPELTFYYKLDAIDSKDTFRVYVYSENDDSWSQVESFNNEQDNTDYRKYRVDLADYIGDSVKVRFEQYITSYTNGARLFLVDDLAIQDRQITEFTFPYSTSFESSDAGEWDVHADFEISDANHNDWQARTGSGFLDNNGNETPEENQRRHYDNHWAEMAGQVAIPLDATAPELSFYYKLDAIDSNDNFRVYIYSAATDTWSLNTTFDNEQDNDGYRKYSISVDAYKDDSISVRFEQYITSYADGARLFVVDDLAIQERPVVAFGYPYTNGFEAGETGDWSTQSDIEISQSGHNGWIANTGSGFLDNNPDEEDQRRHYDNHWAEMTGFVTIPTDAVVPTLSFAYKIDAIDSNDKFYIEVQESDASSWTTLVTLSENDDKGKYAQYDYHFDDSYKGKSIRIRLRQYITSYANGTREFVMDDLRIGNKIVDASLNYPYENRFDTPEERADWNARSDVDISTSSHDTDYVPYSPDGFIDTNPNFEDQQRHYSNHLIEMTKYVTLPNNDDVVLTFKYKLNALDGNDKYYIEIQTSDTANWAVIESLSTQHNHASYTNYEASLAAYKNKTVRLRIRQYVTSYNSGQRLFVVDNWRIGGQTESFYDFPYFNDFETATSTVEVNGDDSDDTNGRDQWNHEGDWDISGVNDNSVTPERNAFDGSYYLNNNGAFDEDQRRHYINHEMSMLGYVLIPAGSTRPEASFYYKLDVLDSNDKFYFEYQVQGNSTWTNIQTFSVDKIHHTHTQFRYALPDSLKGQNVRFRFRQYITSYTSGVRHFTVDNFRLSERQLVELDYPYFNDLEAATSTVVVDGNGDNDVNGIDHWNHEGDWGVSTSSHNNWTPYQGSGFIDNNPIEEDQRRHYSGHTVDMNGALTIPAGANEPELSFYYRLDVVDSNDKFYVEIQQADADSWTSLQTLSLNDEHDEYTQVKINLDSYKGMSVRVRFRQYITSYSNGTRLFTVDNFRIGDKVIEAYDFPYFNGFEDATSDSENGINGRDQWNHQGDWYFSNTTHGDNDQASPKTGSWYLDSNRDDEDQRRKYSNQITEMKGYVTIPGGAISPIVKFDYKLDFIDSNNDSIYLEVQEQGSDNWSNLKQFKLADEQSSYTPFTTSLTAYAGKSIRVRFRTYITSYTNGERYMAIDNFKIGQQFTGWWQMEADTLDASGSNFHASAGGVGNIGFSAVGPANTISPDSTCSYLELSGQNYLSVPSSTNASLLDEYTISTWVYPHADPATGQHYTGYKAIASKGQNYQLKLNNGKVYWWWGGGDRELQSSTTVELDTWTHVAITYKNGEQKLYLNGSLDSSHTSTESLNTSDKPVYFGAELDSGGALESDRHFDGLLDEIRIYETSQTASEIQADMAVVRPCAAAIDHILIEHSGSGVACVDHTVDIKLCADEACDTLYTGGDVTVTLQKDEAGAISTLGNYVVPGASGILDNASFSDTSVASWSLAATSSETSEFECLDNSGGSSNCNYDVTASGLVVVSGDESVGQSCNVSTFTVQAVKVSGNSNSGACVPAFASGIYPVTFEMNYVTPDQDSVTQAADAVIEGVVHNAGVVSGSNIDVAFDSEAKAVIDTSYIEAGEISVAVNDPTGVLSSTSANLKFVPAHLELQWQKLINNDESNKNAATQENNNNANTAALAEDLVVIGQCSDNSITQNYVPSGNYMVQVDRTAPTDSNITDAISTANPNSYESFIVSPSTSVPPNSGEVALDHSGAANKSIIGVNYDEMADLTISVKETNYFGEIIPTATSATATYLNSHYTVSVQGTAVLAKACSSSFSYIGQPLSWATNPKVRVTAKNNDDNPTEFADLDIGAGTRWPLVTNNMQTEMIGNSYQEQGTGLNNGIIGVDNSSFNLSVSNTAQLDGERDYELVSQILSYNKTASADAPFDSNVNLSINADVFKDPNGIGLPAGTTSIDIENITGTELRYGRLKVSNSTGSELETLFWNAEIEYYNASSQWQLNTDDGCTVLNESAVTFTSYDSAGDTTIEYTNFTDDYALFNNGNLTGAETSLLSLNGGETNSLLSNAGVLSLPFEATDEGNIGALEIDVDIETELHWLQWDWDNDGSLNMELPTTSIIFGRYRGNDRIIFKRER